MSLKDQLFLGGVWTDSAVRGSNTAGTPVTSAGLSGTGEEIADAYSLIVSARSGGTGTVTVQAASTNPYNGKVVTGVAFDAATVTKNVVPGVDIVFDTSGANGNTATITIGDPKGSFDATGVGAGVPTAGVRHRVSNTGTVDVVDAKARLLAQAIMYAKTGRVFEHTSPFAASAVEKIAGGGSNRVMPYVLAISGVTGSGPTKVVTLAVDGVTLPSNSVQDLSDGSLHSGVGLKAISPGYRYRIVTGNLSGLEFALSSVCANGDIANVLIFPSRFVQIAVDTAGVEGTYGTSDVDLTTTGQVTGTILASDVAYYWARLLVPTSANNESNPYPCDIALEASESSDAGWTA